MRATARGVAFAAALALSACHAEQTAPDAPDLVASVQANPFLHVTPDGASQSLTWFGAWYQVFDVRYDYNPWTGPLQLNFLCLAEGNARCTSIDRTSVTLTPGQSTQVRVDYNAEMSGSGRVILSAEKPVFPFYSEVQDQGDVFLTIQRPTAGGAEIQVGPDNAQATVYANGSGRYGFQVSYAWLPFVGPQTTGLQCRSTGSVTCTGLSQSVITLNPGDMRTVYADYITAGPGSGYLVVARPGIAGILGEGGDVKLTVIPPPPPLSAGISGPSEVQKGATCTWTASVSGGTPPYRYAWNWAGIAVGTGSSVSVRILISDDLRLTVWDSSPAVQSAQATWPVSVAAVTGCAGGKKVLS